MMMDGLVAELKAVGTFFRVSTKCLGEEDSSFAPRKGMYTVAAQVAHAAQTIDWFVEGAFRPEGFDMNFEAHAAKTLAVTSLEEARRWFDRSLARAIEVVGSKSDVELQESLPPGPVMGGAPRLAIVGGIADHTAHHRGSLAVYARLLGKVPAMPYGEL